MKYNSFLSVSDMSPNDIGAIIKRASQLKTSYSSKPLEDKTVALIFEKPSLRTRVSFEIGIRRLGGESIYITKEEIGLGVREPVQDVAHVLSQWVDCIVARVFSHTNLELLAQHADVPVINALSDYEHPCQALADLLTIYEHKDKLKGTRVAFIGDGNNVASSLALACASVETEFYIATPTAYEIPHSIWQKALEIASLSNTVIEQMNSPQDAVRGADVVYTDVWASMGQEHERDKRIKYFKDYQVDETLMSKAKPNAIFMHDMPAHEGEEISPGMLYSDQSVVFDQADNRLHAQSALLEKLLA